MKLSVIVAVHNESLNIQPFYERASRVRPPREAHAMGGWLDVLDSERRAMGQPLGHV